MVMDYLLHVPANQGSDCDGRLLRPVISATGRLNYADGGVAAPRAHERPESSCGQTHEARYRDLRANRLSPSPPQGAARTPELPAARAVGLVEPDVYSSRPRSAQCVTP